MLFVCFLLASCRVIGQNNLHCERQASFGVANICLPMIVGMKECYTDSSIKAIADKTEYVGNIVLGYYLSDTDYIQRRKLDKIRLSDFCKLYAVNQLKNYSAIENDLDDMMGAVEASFAKENWDKVKATIEKQFDSIAIGKPLLIEKYALDKRDKTFVLLTKYSEGDESVLLSMFLHVLLLQNRIVCFAYYSNYGNEGDLKTAKDKSNAIVITLLKNNL